MRTYARFDTLHKGLTCVNCGQKAIEMHNINDCIRALEASKQDLMTRYLLEGELKQAKLDAMVEFKPWRRTS